MALYRAAWLLPISQPPIRDAWLRTEGGHIVAFGHSRPGDLTAEDETDLGEVAVLPGLVNAHTHLELSWMRDRIRETRDFPQWIGSVIALSRNGEPIAEDKARAVSQAVGEAQGFGTAVVGDVSNHLTTTVALLKSEMAGVIFHELIGFRSEDASRIVSKAQHRLQQVPESPEVRHTLSAHAPYSVSPALFRAIHTTLEQKPSAPCSVHLGESSAEIEFLRCGTGPWRELLDTLGVWDQSWVPPESNPVDYLERLAFLDERLLVVHGVHLGRDEIEKLAATGATLVTCPRGNRRTGAGTPPIAEFFGSGVRVAVGTDSLASVPNLSVFAEIAEMRGLAPDIPPRLLLESATINGARALGLDAKFGTVDVGKRDRLIAVQIEPSTSNVEERLVSGVDASQIRWLTS